ncbi:bifunctional hydroxymethylpyrimidine kinase/phosphomethylpyrimidine kinase [Gudongella sp. SC589]|uniref:bifunctional hydroxymethylpyrimidine kinase/phosphomethylpyrimidine kinase n=1 Tax=Gudongella sp. SC589 TaxID=3385990 RepID=UPI003904B1F4
MKKVLTIAGSDSSGGAGIQGDLKAFSANGTFGMSVITAVTAQNTQGVSLVHDIPRKVIETQISALFDDMEIDGIKIGMVSIPDTIEMIAKTLIKYSLPKIVLDPVMVSKSGSHLLQPDAVNALKDQLVPMAYLITPNIPEAEVLTGVKIKSEKDMIKAAKELMSLGCQNVLIKGGHLEGPAVDILFDGMEIRRFHAERLASNSNHGTGCALSSAICSNLAKGLSLDDAVQNGKAYVYESIKYGFAVGKGVGVLHHFHNFHEGGSRNG